MTGLVEIIWVSLRIGGSGLPVDHVSWPNALEKIQEPAPYIPQQLRVVDFGDVSSQLTHGMFEARAHPLNATSLSLLFEVAQAFVDQLGKTQVSTIDYTVHAHFDLSDGQRSALADQMNLSISSVLCAPINSGSMEMSFYVDVGSVVPQIEAMSHLTPLGMEFKLVAIDDESESKSHRGKALVYARHGANPVQPATASDHISTFHTVSFEDWMIFFEKTVKTNT